MIFKFLLRKNLKMNEEIKNIETDYDIYFNKNVYSEYTDIIINLFSKQKIELLDIKDKNIFHLVGLYNQLVTKNYIDMEIYYLESIKLNNTESMYNLALYYEFIGDENSMIKYLLMAVELNCETSMIYIAKYYYESKNDITKMKHFLSKAIANNNCNSINYLANFYFYTCQDELLEKCLKKSCKLNSSEGYYIYGKYYETKKKFSKMIENLLISIKLGNSDAMNVLGTYYHENKKTNKMIYYYKMGIELGNKDCMNNLAVYYKSVKNYPKMVEYLQMSIDYGDIYAAFLLGKYYQTIEENIDLMLHYYGFASLNGESDASKLLVVYYSKIKNSELLKKHQKLLIKNLEMEDSEL